ncbi:MAG: dTMP kinase [Dehalococcoidales bacterium]|nr:dTMP kinase [Dehalococcoidales bacterium]
MALFITFEGGEGSGKSVQARSLYRRLGLLAIPAILTHEPGGTPLGRKISYWLKWGRHTEISPLTELLLFNASRAQLVTEVIRPNLKGGKVVICDRYTDSTTAYQSYGRGLELEMVRAVNSAATGGLTPTLTVLLDISVEEGLARKGRQKQDRFEQENLAFHRRVHRGYLKMAASEPERWLVIDATQSRSKIREIIWQRVSQLLSTQSG